MAMKRVSELRNARARRRSPNPEGSDVSMNSEPNQHAQDHAWAPYEHPLFDIQMEERGIFMDDHDEGVTAESEKLCQALLEQGTQSPPKDTLFSEDDLFRKTRVRIRNGNEAKVIRDITPFIVPSAEILADRGAEHLQVLRETLKEYWVNSVPFEEAIGSRSGPCPQPDFGLGFRRDAFSPERFKKLEAQFGELITITNPTLISATYNMYLPFFSAEVECWPSSIETADGRNAYTQAIILHGLYSLFRLVGREKELHREINGFSISHDTHMVEIYGHYAVVNGDDVKFYRHPIKSFFFENSDGKDRWAAYIFVRNMYDLWVPKHFARICGVIDMLPAEEEGE